MCLGGPLRKVANKRLAMRVVFAHDHKFLRTPNGEVYSTGNFAYGVWERYLHAFDEIRVIGRVRPMVEHDGKHALSSGSGVSFSFVPDLSNFRARLSPPRSSVELMEHEIERAGGLIVRLPSEIGSSAVRIAQRLRKPFAVEVVGCARAAYWNHGSMLGKAYAPIAWSEMRRIVRDAPFALYVAEFLADSYPTRGQCAIASNVEVPDLNPKMLRQRIQRIRSMSESVTFGTIASLTPNYKGLDTAIEALAQVRDALPKFRYRVLGSGDPHKWQLLASQAGLADNIEFCGTLPAGPAVFKWLDEVDIYLQPSRTEGMPRSLIEAMSRGTPAIGSDVGGIPELLSAECVHAPNDARALSEAILWLARDREALVREAERNAEQSILYGSNRLRRIRSNLWRDFRSYCEKSSCVAPLL